MDDRYVTLLAPYLRSMHWYGYNPYGVDAADWAEYRRGMRRAVPALIRNLGGIV